MNRNNLRNFKSRWTNAKKSQGFSIAELVLVLAAVGGFLYFVVQTYNSTRTSASTNQLLTHTVLVESILKTRRDSPGTTDVTAELVADGRANTGFWKISGAGATLVATNDFNGVGTVTGNTTGYILQETNIPSTACVQIVPQLSTANFKQVKIGAGAAISVPVTTAAAVAACGTAPITLQFIS